MAQQAVKPHWFMALHFFHHYFPVLLFKEILTKPEHGHIVKAKCAFLLGCLQNYLNLTQLEGLSDIVIIWLANEYMT